MKINWQHDVPNQRAPIYMGCVLRDFMPKHNEYFRREYKDFLMSIKNGCSARLCYSEADLKESGRVLLSLALKNPNFVKRTRNLVIRYSRELLKSARQFDKLKPADLKELIDLYKKIFNGYVNIFYICMMPEWSAEYIEEEFKKEVKKLFPSDFNEKINLLSALEDSFIKQEQKDLLAIAKKKNFKELLKKHVKNYFWLENNYIDTKYLAEEYFLKHLKNLKVTGDNKLEKKRKFLRSLKGEKFKRLKVLTDIYEFLPFIHDLRKRDIMEAAAYLNPLLATIGKKTGYSQKEMFLMLPEEIVTLTEKRVDKELLKKRNHHIVFRYHLGVCKIYVGQEADKIEQEMAPFNVVKNKKIFHGGIAYGGKVKGRAKLIKSVKELNQLEQDDILVTSNTTPDFVPYLHLVKAIIAEKGGITSHTSIISREMKIPCLTGIKHITLAIKTGDEIEVDAYKGIVKIIK